MYSFARRPIWLAGHALAGGLLVIFVIAGFWQLSRHNEVSDRNAAITERQDMQPLDADRFFEAVADPAGIDQLEYRTVTLPIRRLDMDGTVLIRNRSLDGVAGCHFAVPAEVPSDDSTESRGVLVVAGWLPLQACEAVLVREPMVIRTPLVAATQVEGRIRRSQERGWLGPADPAQGRLETLARVDVERINRQSNLDLVPAYVEVISFRNPDGSVIEPRRDQSDGTPVLELIPPPELNAGPHLGYTVQWFSFAAVAIVGYTLVLRHQARKGESEQIADD
ncbi:SURF1 family protein [Candidatus Poriferisodalis sp.]|uniref:SURF1 family protein n=1 Tax=Candidatus Poriferisodalis sp. TaxID=3101277 RepID=UPI003B013BF4